MDEDIQAQKIKKIIDIVLSSKVKKILYRGREYYYIYNPISTGIFPIEPEVLEAISDIFLEMMNVSGNIDYILTFEAMGIHIGTALSLKTGIPLLIARKKMFTDDMVEVKREKDSIYLPREAVGVNLVIVDSILSTGTTILETVKVLKRLNTNIRGIFVVIERREHKGSEKIHIETGCRVYSLIKICVSGKEVQLC